MRRESKIFNVNIRIGYVFIHRRTSNIGQISPPMAVCIHRAISWGHPMATSPEPRTL